jgi:hypothetical protein
MKASATEDTTVTDMLKRVPSGGDNGWKRDATPEHDSGEESGINGVLYTILF